MNPQSKLYRGATRCNDLLLSVETFIMAAITIALVAAIFIEVVCRYYLFISVAWAEELTRYLFIWLTYIGTAYAVYEGSHTEIDVFQQILKGIKDPDKRDKSLRMLEFFSIISTFLFLAVFGKLFFEYMMKIWSTTQTSPTMHLPMGLVYLPVFIGVVLSALHEVYLLMVWTTKGKTATEAAE